eukprot:TRINITY_DN681_c0_g1_i1.p1 TRINITY_DN681_c0_g1~~TRINITY_DN681_c0_g1_i1.p1  ORF type:complete len:340 (-),score=114.65 TRINITY_DN681_c0_g1_i1:142-1161(-)
MEAQIPKKVKAVFCRGVGKPLEVAEEDVPTLGAGQVLIKVAYSTINPSDLGTLFGKYPHTKDPNNFVPGFEASGTVVQAGEGGPGAELVGKKVAFFAGANTNWGAWAEYTIAYAAACIPLSDSFDLVLAAAPFVNPLTVISMVETIIQHGATSIVQTAANSALGKMLIRLCREKGIKTINVVRKDSIIDELRSIGGDEVLNSESPDFIEKLRAAVKHYDPKLLFDAVAGDLTTKILKELPKDSIAFVYGALSGFTVNNVEVTELLFQGKEIRGFYLTKFIRKVGGNISKLPGIENIETLLTATLKTTFNNETNLDNINEAIQKYRKLGGEGKWLIKCSN